MILTIALYLIKALATASFGFSTYRFVSRFVKLGADNVIQTIAVIFGLQIRIAGMVLLWV